MSRIAIFAAMLVALAPASTFASLVTDLGPPVTITVGQTGKFEVFLEYDGTGSPIDASVYQVGFDIVAPGDPAAPYEAKFLSGSSAFSTSGTMETYIFAAGSAGASRVDDGSDPTKLVYGDFSLSDQTINPGDIFSLGYIFFTGSTPGTYDVNFTEATVNSTPIDTIGSSITINPAAVPEPSTTLLLGLLAVVAIGVTWRRRTWPAVGATSG